MSKVSHLLPTCWVFRGSRVGCLCIVPTYTSGHSAWRGYEEVSLKLLQIHTHSPSEPPRARGPKRKKPPQSTLTIHYEPWSTLWTVRRTTNSTKRQTLQQSAANDKLYKTTNSTKQQTLQSGKLNDKVQQTRGVKSSWREKERPLPEPRAAVVRPWGDRRKWNGEWNPHSPLQFPHQLPECILLSPGFSKPLNPSPRYWCKFVKTLSKRKNGEKSSLSSSIPPLAECILLAFYYHLFFLKLVEFLKPIICNLYP